MDNHKETLSSGYSIAVTHRISRDPGQHEQSVANLNQSKSHHGERVEHTIPPLVEEPGGLEGLKKKKRETKLQSLGGKKERGLRRVGGGYDRGL